MTKEIPERKQWFLDRVCKTVYRNKTTCNCLSCTAVYEKGLFITDAMHADYVYMCEGMYNSEGRTLKYFDTIKERDEFEEQLKQNDAHNI